MNKLSKILVGLLMMLVIRLGAQDLTDINLAKSFFITVNSVNQSTYQMHGESVGLIYIDNFGRTKTIDLNIYDFKMDLLTRITLAKERGTNEYTVDLQKALGKLEKNLTYNFTMMDENGFEYKWSVQAVELPKIDLEVLIQVDPKLLACGERVGNKVEFSGIVNNGKAPFSFSWYVLDNARSKFMYQPKNDILQDRAEKSVVLVDQNPGYYVVLDVTDSCNGHGRQIVYVSCNKNKKKISSLFVEPLKEVKDKGISTSR